MFSCPPQQAPDKKAAMFLSKIIVAIMVSQSYLNARAGHNSSDLKGRSESGIF